MKFGVILVILSLMLAVVVFSSTPLLAQTVDDRIVVKKSDLPPDVLKQIEMKQKIETYGTWVGLGREVGQAVNEGLQALTKQSEEFSKTGVGRFTMIMIAWKILGSQLIHIVFGILFFVLGLSIFMWAWLLNCRTRRIQVGKHEGGEPNYEVVRPSEAVQLGFGVWFIAHIIVSSIIIFTG